jgi:hypothetical protein
VRRRRADGAGPAAAVVCALRRARACGVRRAGCAQPSRIAPVNERTVDGPIGNLAAAANR